MLTFREWCALREMAGTGAIYDGTKGTFNWQGAPGSSGKIIDGWPIGTKEDKRGKRPKKK